MTGPRIDGYDWPGGREAMLRFGPNDRPVVIAALPLFEEANRTRAFVVAILRALAGRGIASVLPDLPGTGESVVTTADASLSAMREAYEALAGQIRAQRRIYAVSLRSGVLLDTAASLDGRWHLSPMSGEDLSHELLRMRTAGLDKVHRTVDPIDDGTVEIAGNLLSRALLDSLAAARRSTDAVRTVRLSSDPRPADIHLPGPPLWRRSEPGQDLTLVELVASDIADWIAACAG